jgi:hypothetical protein
MFCPNCGAEYRPGFARCSDCDVELVEAAPKGISADSSLEGNLVLLWSGDDLALHQWLLEELKVSGVPYFDRPIGNYSLTNRFPASVLPPFGFEVSVLSSDSKRANVILEKVARVSRASDQGKFGRESE